MTNPYDTIHDLHAYCEGLERRLFAIKAQCAEWERIFGHLGDTPDECGNAIIAARDELEERCDELSADKGTWYRMSEVFSKRIIEVETALKASEEREQELKSQIAKLRNALIRMTKPYKSVPYAQLPPEMHLTLDVLEETK